MKTNRSLGLKKNIKELKIDFYDGQHKEIETNQLEALWELLEIFSNEYTDEIEKIKNWKINHSITEEEYKAILTYLKEENILINDNRYEENEERYINYFQTYPTGLNTYEKIKQANILILGAGTVGSTLAMTLSKFNVNSITLVDPDTVESHNINAQIVFREEDIDSYKVDSLSKYLNTDMNNTNIFKHKFYINEETTNRIGDIIKSNNISIVFSCFDDTNKYTHNKIFKYCKSKNIPYIINGYLDDKVISVLIKNDSDFKIIEESYDNNFEGISNNSGILTHSYINSLLCLRHLINIIEDNIHEKFSSFDLKTMSLVKEQSETFPNFEFLNEEELLKKLTILKKYISTHGSNDFLENGLVSIYKGIEIMKLFPDLFTKVNLLESTFASIMDEIGEEDDTSIVNDLEKEYFSILNNLFIDGERIHKVLSNINYINDYEVKKTTQKKAFEEIKLKSSEILDIMYKIKKNNIDSNYLYEEFPVLYGLSTNEINVFDKTFSNIYLELTSYLYELILPGSEDGLDYLFEIPENQHINYSIEENLDLLCESLSNYSDSLFCIDILNHITNLKKKNLIIDKEVDGIYTTHYFPEEKESIIVFDHLKTMYSTLFLIHEVGHSYFSKFYDKDFYEKSCIIVNEILAHLTEILFANNIHKSEILSKEEIQGFKFQYLYRLNLAILSSYASFDSEKQVLNHIEQKGEIGLDEFIELHKGDNDINKEFQYVNEYYSNLNILVYPSFVLETYSVIIQPIAYAIAIRLYETYNQDIDNFCFKLEELFKGNNINLESFCVKMFNEEFSEQFIKDTIQIIFKHINDFNSNNKVFS